MDSDFTSNRMPFKVEQCALSEWLGREFDLSPAQERASQKRFRILQLKRTARMILVGVPLPAFVIHTQEAGKPHALVSGGDTLGILNRLFLNSDSPLAKPLVIKLETIRVRLSQSQQGAIAAVIDDECIEEAQPSPGSPSLASLLEMDPPADLDPRLTKLWSELHADVRDFQVAYFELNRTRSKLAFQCRSELLTGDRGMGRLLIQPALGQMSDVQRSTVAAWLDLEKPGAQSDLAENVISFARLLAERRADYEEIRAHGRQLYNLSTDDPGLPAFDALLRLANGADPDTETTDFLKSGLRGAQRLWGNLLRPIRTRATNRPDVILPLIFFAASMPKARQSDFAHMSTALERKFAVRFWRSLMNSTGEMTIESLRDLVRQVPRKLPFVDDPRVFIERALPCAENTDASFEEALLDYLNSPSVLPPELLPPHPPQSEAPSDHWTPLHERTSQTERPHIEHLFARILVKRLAESSDNGSTSTPASTAMPAESFLNKWLLEGKLNISKGAKTIREFIEQWRSKYPAHQVERWARSHGIPDLDQLSKLGADPDACRQLRTLLRWKAQHTWKLVSHLQINQQPVGLNAQYVENRLLKYLPPSLSGPSKSSQSPAR